MEARKGMLGKPRRRGKYSTGSPAGSGLRVPSPTQSGGIPKRNTGSPSPEEVQGGVGIHISPGSYSVACSHCGG